MAFVLDNAYILLGSAPLAAHANEVTLEIGVETPEATTFASGGFRERVPGLFTGSFSVGGYFDAEDVDALVVPVIGRSTPLAIAGDSIAGSVVYMGHAVVSAYSLGEAVGSVFPFTLSGEFTGQVARGMVLVNSDVPAGASSSIRLAVGAVTAEKHLFGIAHVRANAGSARGVSLGRYATAAGGAAVDQHAFTPSGGAYTDTLVVADANAAAWWQADIAAGEAARVFVAAGLFSEELTVAFSPLVPPIPTPGVHARFAGVSADQTITAAELTEMTNTHQVTLPSFTANRYLAFAVPNDENDISGLVVVGSGLNQIGAFSRIPGTLDKNGVALKVWRSNAVWFPSATSGSTWEIRQ